MIKSYTPNALIAATQQVIKRHSLSGNPPQMLDQAQLKELVKYICNSPMERLPAIALSLSKRQNTSLAMYFAKDQQEITVQKIGYVLRANMNTRLFVILAEEWQSYPRNRELLKLLEQSDTPENHPKDYPIKRGMFRSWLNNWEPVGRYYKSIQKHIVPNTDEHEHFADLYGRYGMHMREPLYTQCFAAYLMDCSMNAFVTEGDRLVVTAMEQVSFVQMANGILNNLLEKAARNYRELAAFRECYQYAYRRFQTPERSKFPSEAAFLTYQWWYNYQILVEGFNRDADQNRVKFWSQYLDRCTVTRLRRQQFLFMNFGKYYAVESEMMGKIYFYSTDYFESVVRLQLVKCNASEGKSWMYNSSRPAYSKAHQGNWQSEVSSRMRILEMI